MDLIEDEAYYKVIYDRTLRSLETRMNFSGFDIEELENELEALYIHEGNNQEGRNGLIEAEIAASISAYQVVLHNYKKTLS